MSVTLRTFTPLLTRTSRSRTFGILSTYPPTACGLATFSAALSGALEAIGATVKVVRVADAPMSYDPRVIAELENGRPASVREATTALNTCDTVIVQHEYGLYGGTDGDELLDILRELTVPAIVVAHTVLLDPSDHQREVLEAISETASAVVVMAETARERLYNRFDVEASKITMIPHGATLPSPNYRPDRSGRPMLLTWGLLGRGKGIEWAIDAMAELKDLRPRPRYVIAGRTHPKVLLSEGEAYREALVARTWANGVAPSVSFDSTYRDLPSLTHLVQQATLVVLPYDSHDQVTSGVLVDAIAAGRPVVATAFPHAVELLSSGAGIVVPHRDPEALGTAIRLVLSEPGLCDSMAAEAARLAPGFGWSAVARQYVALAENLQVAAQAVPA